MRELKMKIKREILIIYFLTNNFLIMNKKLISALFVGALLLGSTSALTSCKDYDDDINDLQAQIDKKALQADVDALKTSLASATATATAAQTTANSALAAAQKANDAVALKAAQADLDAAVKRIAALETKTAELEAFEKKLQDAVDSEISKLETEFATLKSQISDLIGQMITNVSLVATLDGWDEDDNAVAAYDNRDVAIYNTYEKANVFGKDMTGAITFTAGKLVNFAEGVIIRVTPTSVDLTKDAVIKLVRSNGNAEVNNMMEVASVEKYTGDILVSRAASTMETGLWIVKFKLTDAYNADDFNALTLNDSGKYQNGKPWADYYGYGIQINNTANNETRYAPSEYDVALMTKAVTDEIEELFTVNGKPITELHNRYQWCENEEQTKTFTATATGVSKYSKFIDELTWSANKKNPAVSASAGDVIHKTDTGKDGGIMTNNDNRQAQPLLPVTVNQNIKISFNYATALGSSYKDKNVSVRGFYVTLDTQNALESAPSEINAWNSYSYEGLNTVQEGKTAIIKITANKANGDKIGFRVYAVNYDGTLVDPDGRAFYVVVGDEAKTETVAKDIIGNSATDGASSAETVLGAKYNSTLIPLTQTFGSNTTYVAGTIALDNASSANVLNNADIYYQLVKSDGKTAAGDWKDAKYIKVSFENAANFLDGATYSGTVSANNSDGVLQNQINVSVTKVLPDTFPAAFSPKAGQVVDGVYTCYVDPVAWATENAWAPAKKDGTLATVAKDVVGKNGSKALVNVFNDLSDANYKFVFANAAYKKDGKTLKDLAVTSAGFSTMDADDGATTSANYTFNIANKFIDSSTAHETNVYYTYKGISTTSLTDATKQGLDKDVLGLTISTKFACVLNTTLQTYAWAQRPAYTTTDKVAHAAADMNVLQYNGKDVQYIACEFLKGTNAFDPTNYSKTYNDLAPYYVYSATLTSKSNSTVDYFNCTGIKDFAAMQTLVADGTAQKINDAAVLALNSPN